MTSGSSWFLSGSEIPTRKAFTLTTAARNLTLVLLIAVQSFSRSGIEVALITFTLIELAFMLLIPSTFAGIVKLSKSRRANTTDYVECPDIRNIVKIEEFE